MGRVDYELAYLPTGLKCVLLASLVCLVLGVVWAVTVWCVAFPPGGWGCWGWFEERGKGKRKGGKEKERRPIDKPSKYAAPGEVEMSAWEERNKGMSWDTAWDPVLYGGRSATKRPRSALDPTYRTHTPSSHSCSSSRETGQRFPSTPGLSSPESSRASSPLNPFLQPPGLGLQRGNGRQAGSGKRSSREWILERGKFFNNNNNDNNPTSLLVDCTSSPAAASLHTSNGTSGSDSYSLETSYMEALEAGIAPLTGHAVHTSSCENGSVKEEKSTLRKRLSWLDQGLEMVDGAVESVASGLARWTDDGDGEGEEGLLLPVARRDVGGGRMRGGGVV